MPKTPISCAIYTRKSSDEGLEQDFNSLDAQREACAAYIASQKGEGWKLVSGRYDDGGISGGTLDRPGLQKLLADIESGKVELVVVYKVDRLTRSLTDFAKLVERFDATGASFVSVTQQFNTATSMGRLTLNVLLSFAQFEREVTAERIRDKIAASKKKGLWMGGLAPLGYDAKDRTLVVNEREAETVRTLFRLYLELGSVRRVKEEADRLGLVSKRRSLADGTASGGVPFTRGRIHHLLANPIYIGEIRHKTQSYPGQHPAIVERANFDAVRAKLDANTRAARGQATAKESSPLAGKFTDETGDRLTPSHAVRRGRRHRYYVSRRLIAHSGERNTNGWRLPAVALESAVARLITDALAWESSTRCLVQAARLEDMQKLASRVQGLVEGLNGHDRGTTLRALVDTGRIEPGRLSVMLDPATLAERLGVLPIHVNRDALTLTGDFTLRRRGVEARLLFGDTSSGVDGTLIKNVAQGWAWFEEIKTGPHGTGRRRSGCSMTRGYIYKLLSNPLYAGRIAHGNQTYEGLHPAIIDQDTWDAVQTKLSSNSAQRIAGERRTEPSPLLGKLYDERGMRLTPSHAVKKGRRYRYYVSRDLFEETAGSLPEGQGWRLPAQAIEDLVRSAVCQLLGDPAALAEALRRSGVEAERLPGLLAAIQRWRSADLDLVERVDLAATEIAISLSLTGTNGGDAVSLRHTIPIRLKRRGVEMRLVLASQDPYLRAKTDPALIRGVIRARRWFEDLAAGRAGSVKEIAEKESISDRYVSALLPLAFLAPEIVEAILKGAQPADLTLERLMKRTALPYSWAEQKALLGFD